MKDNKHLALEAIRKKLIGKTLNYKEIYAIMDEIANERLGDVLTTYFVASGYSRGFTNEEVYYLTKAMVETGERLKFDGIVADKHSIGGVPGTRTTLIVIPIVASAGFKIPKSSSRAITTPAGTADCMEVIAGVTFDEKKIYEIVEKTNACIVWGGSFKIAPADDEIIRIEEPLLFESFDKILVSVMAKKIAFGSNHVVIDIPYGKTVKVHGKEEAEVLGDKFKFLAEKFSIKLTPFINKAEEPMGCGIGPLLETRDSLKVLEQTEDRAMPLEKKAIDLAEILLDISLEDSPKDFSHDIRSKYKSAREWAIDLLVSGKALSKMKEIIELQGGNRDISSGDLKPGKFSFDWIVKTDGKISEINNKNITLIAKILGAPQDKKAGLLLHKRTGEEVKKGDILFSLFSENKYLLTEAIDSLDLFPMYTIIGK
jgi:AMP phosphorylase